MLPKCKTPHFAILSITGYYDSGQFQHAGNKDTDPSCHVMYRLPLFVALCDHNPPMSQTDGQTDVMLVA